MQIQAGDDYKIHFVHLNQLLLSNIPQKLRGRYMNCMYVQVQAIDSHPIYDT